MEFYLHCLPTLGKRLPGFGVILPTYPCIPPNICKSHTNCSWGWWWRNVPFAIKKYSRLVHEEEGYREYNIFHISSSPCFNVSIRWQNISSDWFNGIRIYQYIADYNIAIYEVQNISISLVWLLQFSSSQVCSAISSDDKNKNDKIKMVKF